MDTRNKRASALFPALAFLRPLPDADGAVGAGDRIQVAGTYRGLPYAAEVVADVRWGVGGFAAVEVDVRWGVGGFSATEVQVLWQVAPSPNRIEWALSGRYGPVVAGHRYERRTIGNQYLSDVPGVSRCDITANNNRPGSFRTATFYLRPGAAPELDPLADHIAVFTDVMVDGNYEVALQWGLFSLTHPGVRYTPNAAGGNHEEWTLGALDLGDYLVADGPGEPYVVTAGTNYMTAIATILDALALQHALPAVADTLPEDKAFASTATWRDIVNELTDGCNHYTVKPDETGRFRTRERTDLAVRTPDVAYADTDFILIPIDKDTTTTTFANKVIATCTDPVLSSVRTNEDPTSPISFPRIGRWVTRRIQVDAAADQTALDAAADAYLRDAAYVYDKVRLETFIDPRRGANEVVALTVDGLWDGVPWQVQDWSVSLSDRPAPRMRHTLGRIVSAAVE
ncbi:MAG: hypothetical protein ACSLE9_07960 [Burkholderiaceae bacterium]